jgi:methylphosphotriester-DNA--protein-cysteine methyltransferase
VKSKAPAAAKTEASSSTAPFIGNKSSKKVHRADCRWGMKTSPAKRVYFKTYEEAAKAGYIPCKACKPDLAAGGAGAVKSKAPAAAEGEFCASVKGKAFHRPSCMWASKISPRNLVRYKTREEAIAAGKKPCSTCKP